MPKRSASLQNPPIIDLCASRTLRDRRRVFPIEGVRNFIQASDQNFTFREIIYSEKLLIHPIARKLVRRHRRAGVPTRNVSPETFRAMSKAKHASGVAAVLKQNWTTLDETTAKDGLFWLLVERVNAPGNLGTLLRSSHAFGGAGLICVGSSVDPFSADVVRASMGALFSQRFVRTDWESLVGWAERGGRSIVGATPDGSAHKCAFDSKKPPVIMLGEERKGLTEAQRMACDQHVRIPMQPGTDSLNLGVAGSLLMYDVYRHHLSY